MHASAIKISDPAGVKTGFPYIKIALRRCDRQTAVNPFTQKSLTPRQFFGDNPFQVFKAFAKAAEKTLLMIHRSSTIIAVIQIVKVYHRKQHKSTDFPSMLHAAVKNTKEILFHHLLPDMDDCPLTINKHFFSACPPCSFSVRKLAQLDSVFFLLSCYDFIIRYKENSIIPRKGGLLSWDYWKICLCVKIVLYAGNP